MCTLSPHSQERSVQLMRDDTDTKRVVIDGYAYVSSNGQLVIDRHPTDEAHLLAEQTRDSQPLYDCRTYLADLIPKEWFGKRGRFAVSSFINDHGAVVVLQLIFTPDEVLQSAETTLAGEQGDLPAASAR